MSENKRTVERCLAGFSNLDHKQILDCLDDDVEWVMPGAFHVHGKDAFEGQIESDCYEGKPVIVVSRLTEEADVVIAEGSIKSALTDGGMLDALFCDVYEMSDGKVRKLTSYLATL